MYLSVIIPAYNEEKRLANTVHKVFEFLSKQPYESEIIIVNDGSKDGTHDLLKSLAENIQNLIIFENEKNSGKGFSVRRGMLEGRGEIRLFMDADGSTPIEELDKLLPYIKHGHDVVIGSRRVSGANIKKDQPWYRVFLGFIFRNIVNFIMPLGVIDSQNGFKLFTSRAANDIFERQRIDRWAFDVEVLALAKKLGYKIKEVPIVWTDSNDSKVKLGGMVRMLWEVVRVRISV